MRQREKNYLCNLSTQTNQNRASICLNILQNSWSFVSRFTRTDAAAQSMKPTLLLEVTQASGMMKSVLYIRFQISGKPQEWKIWGALTHRRSYADDCITTVDLSRLTHAMTCIWKTFGLPAEACDQWASKESNSIERIFLKFWKVEELVKWFFSLIRAFLCFQALCSGLNMLNYSCSSPTDVYIYI